MVMAASLVDFLAIALFRAVVARGEGESVERNVGKSDEFIDSREETLRNRQLLNKELQETLDLHIIYV